jgi:hypothetical protein
MCLDSMFLHVGVTASGRNENRCFVGYNKKSLVSYSKKEYDP